MEGDGGSKNNKKGVRRPMNAFLIFCKRQRSKVREKNPQMDNRSITRVLGDIWAKMDKDEKASFTHLAKQYKDAFMKANPGYKWHSSDRVHSGGAGTSKVVSKHGSSVNTTASTIGKLSSTSAPGSSKHQHYQNIRVSSEITPGKLADPGQMGGLNLLLKAGKESEMMQSKSKPTRPTPASSLFSFTPISIPPPTKSYLSLSSPALSSSSSLSCIIHATSNITAPKPTRCTVSSSPLSSTSSSSSLFQVPGVESATANSALLQLAEMCTTELYSGTEEHPSAPASQPLAPANVAPPKKRAKQWHSESLSPLADENGRKHGHGSCPANNNVNMGKSVSGNDAPLDLSQANCAGIVKKSTWRRQSRGSKGDISGGGRDGASQTWSRKRKQSSSATDSVSSSPSPSASPITVQDVISANVASQLDSLPSSLERREGRNYGIISLHPDPMRGLQELNAHHSFHGIRQDTLLESSKVASLLKAAQPLSLPSTHQKQVDRLLSDSKSAKKTEVSSHSISQSSCSSISSSLLSGGLLQQQQQPFTQGKVKKKWTQRMLVEAQQEEELALAKKESESRRGSMQAAQFLSSNPGCNCANDHSKLPAEHDFKLEKDGDKKTEDYKPPQQPPWGKMDAYRKPLPPPPPINTSFPLPISGSNEAHRSHTLYKALTSEISPPRHRPRTIVPDLQKSSPSSSIQPPPVQSNNKFDPITACGKKFTDRIVEQLVLHGSTSNKRDELSSSSSASVTSSSSSVSLFPPIPSSSTFTQDITDLPRVPVKLENVRDGISNTNNINSCKSEMGIWDSVSSRFSMDSDDKGNSVGAWATSAAATGKRELLDGQSFPASSLFEKVARKVCGSQRDVKSPHSSGLSPHEKTKVENKFVDISPSSMAQPLPPSEVDHSVCMSDNQHQLDSDRGLAFEPVRKSRRANRGQKYQALIKEGIIQPSKERMAVRNAPLTITKPVQSDEQSVMDQEIDRVSKNRDRATPSPRTVRNRASPVELFDFDKVAVTSPLVTKVTHAPQQQLKRKFNKHRKVCSPLVNNSKGCIAATGSDPRADACMGADGHSSSVFVQSNKFGKLSFSRCDKTLGATLTVKPRMKGWCHTRIPLTRTERNEMKKLTGYNRRKMRNIRFVHTVSEPSDSPMGRLDSKCNPADKSMRNDSQVITGGEATESSTLSMSMKRRAENECGASVVPYYVPRCPNKTLIIPHTPSSGPTTWPGHDDIKERLVDSGMGGFISKPDDMISPLHLLTSAAMQSERAIYPTVPQSISLSNDPSSFCNSTSRISPRPASVPLMEDVRVRLTDNTVPSSLSTSSQQINSNSSLLSSSMRPPPPPPHQIPSSVVASPRKLAATSALLSLSALSAPQFTACSRPSPTMPIPSTPNTVSTLTIPPQAVAICSASYPSSKSTKHTVLNIPAITCSSRASIETGTYSHIGQTGTVKNNDSTMTTMNRPLHPSHQHQSNNSQAVMQHSQKLVRLLTNTEDINPFANAKRPADNHHQAGNVAKSKHSGVKKVTKALPLVHRSAVGVSANTHGSRLNHLPQSRKRIASSSPNNKKQKKKKLSMGQHQSQTLPQSLPCHQNVVKGSKLFPTAIVNSPTVTTASIQNNNNSTSQVKKIKPTIWDHLSSQCSVPVKLTKKPQPTNSMATVVTLASPLPLPQSQLQQRKDVTPTNTAHVSTTNSAGSNSILTANKQSPAFLKPIPSRLDANSTVDKNKPDSATDSAATDSADEQDDNKPLCIVEADSENGSSDTDSAEESEFESSTAKSSLQAPHSQAVPAAKSVVLNLDREPVSSQLSEDGHKPLLGGLNSQLDYVQRLAQGKLCYSAPKNPLISPVVTATATSAISSSPRSSYAPISSITLPDGDVLPTPPLTTIHDETALTKSSILFPTTQSSSSQVTVKTIAPTSPYPSPHVTDLSAQSVTVSPLSQPPQPTSSSPSSLSSSSSVLTTTPPSSSYGNILLSTLTNPHLFLVPHHQSSSSSTVATSPSLTAATSPLLSHILVPASSTPINPGLSSSTTQTFTSIVPVPSASTPTTQC